MNSEEKKYSAWDVATHMAIIYDDDRKYAQDIMEPSVVIERSKEWIPNFLKTHYTQIGVKASTIQVGRDLFESLVRDTAIKKTSVYRQLDIKFAQGKGAAL